GLHLVVPALVRVNDQPRSALGPRKRYLQREVKDLRPANDILKTASAFFAQAELDRRILPFRVSPTVAAYLAYELHLAGVGDNASLNHDNWKLFGLACEDVLEEIKRLSLQGLTQWRPAAARPALPLPADQPA
ncbi:MAG: hypothetical protein P8N60_06495, partial [Burkholderiaceae bacterium]|nr:hypothetical protein [Burkholderiaceae bacterium]